MSHLEIAELFYTMKQIVSLHIRNILAEDELAEAATVKDSLTAQEEGQRQVKRKLIRVRPTVVARTFSQRHDASTTANIRVAHDSNAFHIGKICS